MRGVKDPLRRIAGRWANAFLDYLGEPRTAVAADPPMLSQPSPQKPDWASTIGRHRFGTFVIIDVPAPRGKRVTQRLRWIPPGKFLMGSAPDDPDGFPRERPQQPIAIRQGFWLFDMPCTQALWEAVMGENPSKFKGPNRPVEQVSWNDAQSFLSRLQSRFGLSLPSEAQWEYACRAGTEAPPVLDDVAWFSENSGGKTHDVATKAANAFGLYDMLGNVAEWCEDSWRNTHQGAALDGTAHAGGAGRVLRGGSWYHKARDVRSASRNPNVPALSDYGVGFRCARVQ